MIEVIPDKTTKHDQRQGMLKKIFDKPNPPGNWAALPPEYQIALVSGLSCANVQVISKWAERAALILTDDEPAAFAVDNGVRRFYQHAARHSPVAK